MAAKSAGARTAAEAGFASTVARSTAVWTVAAVGCARTAARSASARSVAAAESANTVASGADARSAEEARSVFTADASHGARTALPTHKPQQVRWQLSPDWRHRQHPPARALLTLQKWMRTRPSAAGSQRAHLHRRRWSWQRCQRGKCRCPGGWSRWWQLQQASRRPAGNLRGGGGHDSELHGDGCPGVHSADRTTTSDRCSGVRMTRRERSRCITRQSTSARHRR